MSAYTSKLNFLPGLQFLCLVAGIGICLPLSAVTRHVGAGQPYISLTQAVAVTVPGDTIMIHKGTYPGGLSIVNLQGTAVNRICIMSAPSETVIFNGGANSWQMTDAAYVLI